jgi:site-specific recombinase XerD
LEIIAKNRFTRLREAQLPDFGSFNRTVVLRYRMHLEARSLAPGTVNLRLGAVRRLAYEAADCGLLSPDLAAGVRRVKGLKKLGVRLGNWLTAERGEALWQSPHHSTLKGKRDQALLAVLTSVHYHQLKSECDARFSFCSWRGR